MELMLFLKDNGMLTPQNRAICLDLVTDPGNTNLLNSYMETLAPEILRRQLAGSPFGFPDNSVDGPIGLAIAENGQRIGMFPHECHVLAPGMTGQGKTTLIRIIFSQGLIMGLGIWLFVRAPDTRCLLDVNKNILVLRFDGSIKINPLNPCGIPVSDYCNTFADNFITSMSLFDGTKSYLLEHLNNLYRKFEEYGKWPSLFDLLSYTKYLPHRPLSREFSYRESLKNRLSGLLSGPLGKVFDCSRGYEESLFGLNCIWEIDNLTTEQQRFVVNHFITGLFYHRLNKSVDKWLLCGLDDSNLIFDASLEKRPDFGLPKIHDLLCTVRKSKINIFCCTQTPHQLGGSINSNSAIKVLFNLANGKDFEFMFKSIGNLTDEQMDFCYSLQRGQIVIKNSYRFPKPIFGVIPQIPDARQVADEEIKETNHRILSLLPPVIPRYEPPQSEIKTGDEPGTSKNSPEIPEKVVDTLRDIYSRFDIPSSKRASDLGLNAEAANKVSKYLERNQLVETIKLNMSGKRGGLAKYYFLTDKGLALIKKPPLKRYSGGKGATHLFIQMYLKKYLPEMGFKDVVIEKNIEGKRIDLFAKYNDTKVAIEICNSTFKYEHVNVQKDFDKCDHLIIAVTDKKSKQKLENVLYKKIQRHPKIKTCLIHELLNPSSLKELLNKRQLGIQPLTRGERILNEL